MNHLRVTILLYGLLLFACLGQDTIIDDENTEPDLNATASVDGSSAPEVDMGMPPMMDMAGMIDMELPHEPEEQRLSSSVCGLNEGGFYREIWVDRRWVTPNPTST